MYGYNINVYNSIYISRDRLLLATKVTPKSIPPNVAYIL